MKSPRSALAARLGNRTWTASTASIGIVAVLASPLPALTCRRCRSSSVAIVRLSVPLSPPAGTTNCAVTVKSNVLLLLLYCWDTRAPMRVALSNPASSTPPVIPTGTKAGPQSCIENSSTARITVSNGMVAATDSTSAYCSCTLDETRQDNLLNHKPACTEVAAAAASTAIQGGMSAPGIEVLTQPKSKAGFRAKL